MTTLVIDRRDADLDAEGGTVVVRIGNDLLARAPIAPLERVLVRGRARLTTSLIASLHERGVGLCVLGGRRNELVGMLLGKPHADANVRIGQALLYADPRPRREIAAQIVRRKIQAQHRLLMEEAGTARGDRRHLLAALASLPSLAERATTAADLAGLTGIEGAASAAHFAALAEIFPTPARFAGRNRRPPRDPANAVLSFGYTLATFEAAREATIAGLDPLIGFLHALVPGRPSLACDLIEPLRSSVDGWAIALFRSGGLRADHFARDGNACLLGKAGRGIVHEAWERQAVLMRRWLRLACRVLVRKARAAAVLGGIDGWQDDDAALP